MGKKVIKAGIEEIRAAEELVGGKSKSVQVFVTEARHRLYVEAAQKADLSLSAWARKLLDAALVAMVFAFTLGMIGCSGGLTSRSPMPCSFDLDAHEGMGSCVVIGEVTATSAHVTLDYSLPDGAHVLAIDLSAAAPLIADGVAPDCTGEDPTLTVALDGGWTINIDYSECAPGVLGLVSGQ